MLLYSRYHARAPRYAHGGDTARKLGWVFFTLSTALLFLALVTRWLIEHDVLLLKEVYVEGTVFTSKETIYQLAQPDFSRNIFEIDFDEMAERVKQHPLVRDADVRLRFPSSIVIQVVEREPLAVLAGEQLVAIDDSGKALPASDPKLLHDCPVITNLPAAATTDSSAASPFADVVACLRQIRENNFALYSEISEISYSPKVGIYFYLTNGSIPVLVGADDFGTKADNLMKVYRILEQEETLSHVEYFDLRFRGQVVVKEQNVKS